MATVSKSISTGVTFLYHNTQKADMNYYQGQRLFKEGEYAKAVENFEKALSFAPEDSQTKLIMAQAMQYSGEAEEAVEVYEELPQEALDEDEESKLRACPPGGWRKYKTKYTTKRRRESYEERIRISSGHLRFAICGSLHSSAG